MDAATRYHLKPQQIFLSMDSLPEALREMREEKRLVQSEAAKTIGVCVSSLSMWENGVRTPSWTLLPVIAAAYGYKIEFVISKVTE